ncbi:hypothetical protein [Amphritea sp.]|uniref:hypothetical protein n=1 Tax=Amphritea sp. TaxID=1872502 RepID=UPI003A91ABBB
MSRSGLGWFAVSVGGIAVRWCFLILLLINGAYLGWQMQQPERHKAVSPANVTSLRLLSEEDRSLLLPRRVSTATENQPAEAWCQVVRGIEVEAVAYQWQERLERLGLTALVAPADIEQVQGYELTLDQPIEANVQRVLEARLVAQGLGVETVRLGSRWVYIVGRYPTRETLNEARDGLLGVFQLGEYQVVSQIRQYEVWIEADGSSETSNKIKEVDDFFDSSIKIEKKLCKGVASTGVRD